MEIFTRVFPGEYRFGFQQDNRIQNRQLDSPDGLLCFFWGNNWGIHCFSYFPDFVQAIHYSKSKNPKITISTLMFVFWGHKVPKYSLKICCN